MFPNRANFFIIICENVLQLWETGQHLLIFWIHKNKHMCFCSGVLFIAGHIFRNFEEVVWFCSSSKSEGNYEFCWIHVLKTLVLSNSSGVSGDWMNPMERAYFPGEARQLCLLLPLNRGEGHGYVQCAMLAGPSVVCATPVSSKNSAGHHSMASLSGKWPCHQPKYV